MLHRNDGFILMKLGGVKVEGAGWFDWWRQKAKSREEMSETAKSLRKA